MLELCVCGSNGRALASRVGSTGIDTFHLQMNGLLNILFLFKIFIFTTYNAQG